MKYRNTITVQYQDVDTNRRIKLFVLENYLLQTAADVADRLGFGLKQLMPYNYTWIVTNINIEMTCLPTHTEQIIMETWIESNAHSLSTRNFRIYLKEDNGKERLIGRARTVWAVLDFAKREIVNIFSMPMFEGAVDGEQLDMPRSPRIRTITDPTGMAQHTVAYSDMDYNGHCNSCKYLQMMMDTCLPEAIARGGLIGASAPIRIELTYSKEVYFGETVSIIYAVEEDNVCYQIRNEEGLTSCSCRITHRQNETEQLHQTA